MARTIKLNHSDIKDPQKITGVTEKAFKNEGLNLHVNEVVKMDDDNEKGIRYLEVKNTKTFCIGDVPWHRSRKE